MAKTLNDTQRIILATAAERPDHQVLPLPEGLRAPAVAVQRTLTALITAGLVIRAEDGTARITPAGLAAMGISGDAPSSTEAVEEDEGGSTDRSDAGGGHASTSTDETNTDERSPPVDAETIPVTEPDKPLPKSRIVVEMLRRGAGVSIAEISDATCWQAHSVRGFLTATVKGRMKLPLVSDKDDEGVRRYHIAVLRNDKTA